MRHIALRPLCTDQHKIKPEMRDGKYPQGPPSRGPGTLGRETAILRRSPPARRGQATVLRRSGAAIRASKPARVLRIFDHSLKPRAAQSISEVSATRSLRLGVSRLLCQAGMKNAEHPI